MRLGVNTVLFGGFDLETAFRCAAMAGYDAVELSAIEGMGEHLVLGRATSLLPQIRALAAGCGLGLLAIEQPSLEPSKMELALVAAAELGIPIVNCGPGGKTGDEESLSQTISSLWKLSRRAGELGVTLCVKAHVGCAIHDTPTSLRTLAEIDEPSFGLDFDPSHILRAGEDPVESLRAVVHRVRHIHVRDCRKGIQGPGKPEEQTPGRGDIDLRGLVGVLKDAQYNGPVDLEIIGAREYPLEACTAIAAEARRYLREVME